MANTLMVVTADIGTAFVAEAAQAPERTAQRSKGVCQRAPHRHARSSVLDDRYEGPA
jgi:hypothetical protein